MGTTWSARLVDPPAGVAAVIAATLARIVGEMSQWDAGSHLSRFNRAPLGEWSALPPDLRRVIDAALDVAAASGGAFDVAGGTLADLWGFGPPGPRDRPPDAAQIAAALAASGASGIERLGDRARRIRPVALDLSGIAKGFAVDAVADALAAAGVADALVEIGGEFVGRGIRPDGQPWWVDLETPPGVTLTPLRIAASGCAVATSGDYRRFVRGAGGTAARLGHTIDPRTGRPVENAVVSVSVIADTAMTADAWATALTVLVPDDGAATADRDGLAARIVTRDGREILSTAMADALKAA